jgi:hypothetical protein
MTTFKGIRGTTIEVLSSDPSNPEQGQIWYNSSSGTLKGYKAVNTWSSGGNLPSARAYMGSAGTQTAALGFGGNLAPGTAVGTTSSYNGIAWTDLPATMNTARNNFAGAGITQTAALGFGGYRPGSGPTTASESYNGTSWTNTPSLNTARAAISSFGTQTAALAIAGVNTTAVESWNGSSWTNSTSLPTPTGYVGSAGIQTAGIIFGGQSGPGTAITTSLSWNGSSWTAAPSMNTARSALGSAGTQTSALGFGGTGTYPAPALSTTELYNGTAWTSNPTGLGTARYYIAKGTGMIQTAALAIGGLTPSTTAATEAWTGVGIKTITVS